MSSGLELVDGPQALKRMTAIIAVVPCNVCVTELLTAQVVSNAALLYLIKSTKGHIGHLHVNRKQVTTYKRV